MFVRENSRSGQPAFSELKFSGKFLFGKMSFEKNDSGKFPGIL